MPHWSWGLSTALILALVIHLNGKGIRLGWLLGATVQFINLGFGYFVYGQWTFLFLLAPAAMFLVNWWLHPNRVRARQDVTRCPSRFDYATYPGPLHCSLFAGHLARGVEEHVAFWREADDPEMHWVAWEEVSASEQVPAR